MEKPIWSPSPERVDRANLSRFMRFVRDELAHPDLLSYAPLWQLSVDQPEKFWTLLWDFCGIRGSGAREPLGTPRDPLPGADWFPQIRLNYAQNVLRFDDERSALIQRGSDGELHRTSHAELRRQVAAAAAALRADGVGADDCVFCVLDNGAEALVAALAAASIGARVAAASATMSSTDCAERVAACRPRVLVLCAARADLATTAADIGRVVLVPNGHPATAINAGQRFVTWPAWLEPHLDATPDYTATAFGHPLHVVPGPSPAQPWLHGAGGTLIQHLKELLLHLDLKRDDKLLVIADCGSPAWRWAVSAPAVGVTLMLQPRPRSDAAVSALWEQIDSCGITAVITDGAWLERSRALGLLPNEDHRLLALRTLVVTDAPAAELVDYVYGAVKARLLLISALHGSSGVGCITLGNPLLPVPRELPLQRALGMRTASLEGSDLLAIELSHPSLPLALVGDRDDGAGYRAQLRSEHPALLSTGIRARSIDGQLHPLERIGALGARLEPAA